MAQAPDPRPAVGLRLDAEAAAAAVPALLIAAERLAASVDPGAHGLRRAGAGEEFWQYRPAAPGDPAGLIDWRRSARSDAAFVRERERQSPQAAALWVAGDPGMAWTGDPARPLKRDRARLLALALALVLLRGGERVAVGADDARAGRLRAEALARDLLTAAPDPLPPPGTLRPQRRVVLLGDFLGDPAPLARFLADAAATGSRGVLMQVLDPTEESFPFAGALRFHAPGAGAPRHETGQNTGHETRNATALRPAYLARLAERRALLARLAAEAGWQFGTHDTAAPPAAAVLWLAEALSA